MIPTSRLHARALIGAAVTVLVALLPAAAGATTTSQGKASITKATTGMTDPSPLVPRRACDVPRPGHAACLAQFLAVRRTGAPVHPHLLPAAPPRRLLRVRAGSPRAARALAVAAATTAMPAPQPGGTAYLQQAYDVAALSQTAGGDQTIAIVDAYDDNSAEADLATYRSQFGLPPCTSGNGCFKKLNEFGNPSPLPSRPPNGTDWQKEVALDLDAVSAICPNCKIVLVEAFTDGIGDLAEAQYSAAHASPAPSVITDSWGAVPANSTSVQNANTEQKWIENTGTFTFPGIATVAASGDFGYLGAEQNQQCPSGFTQASCNVYPAALPGVTAAGGTSMVPTNGTGVQAARGLSETAWSRAGSGCDTTEGKPSWQTDTGCSGRSYTDLSADADPATGMDVYNSGDGGWEIVGGTSEASALIAAYYALVRSATNAATTAAGGTRPSWAFNTAPSWAYNVASTQPTVFNDATSGSNGTCETSISYICNASVGYDGPTGIGTISGAVVPGAPGLGVPGFGEIGANNSSYTESVTTNSATLQGGVYPNGNDTSYYWEYGTTTAYGQTTTLTDVGSGTAPVQVTDTILRLTAGTTYHYRLVALSPDPDHPGSYITYPGSDFTLTTSNTGNSAGSGGGGTGGGTGNGSGAGTTVTGNGSGAGTTVPGNGGGTTGTGSGGTPPMTHAPNAPSFGVLRIRALGSHSATVTEMLYTGGGTTIYYLAYGTTSKMNQRTAAASAARSGTITWHLRGLRTGAIYHLEAVAANGGGTRHTATVRVKTSPVSVGKITARGNKLHVALRCRGSSSCMVKLAVKIGKHKVASGRATIRGKHVATVTLKLNRAAAARATHAKRARATLSAVSVWNGYAATVAAKFKLILS